MSKQKNEPEEKNQDNPIEDSQETSGKENRDKVVHKSSRERNHIEQKTDEILEKPVPVREENGVLKVDDNLIEPGNVDLDFNEDSDEQQSILDKNEVHALEMEKEFRKEIAFDKEAEASSDEELYLRMKRRIVKSFRWHEDIIIPFSRELKISQEELEEILMKRLDMSSLEALQPRFESSKFRCTRERIHSDLKLCWLSDVMNLLTLDEAEEIKNRITSKIVTENESYEKALEEGRKELVEYLKR